jgi:hypothetical protein
LSSAVVEKPEAPALNITHLQDRGLLMQYGADLEDPALVKEYFEYRNTFRGPGIMDSATLHRLAVEQRKRTAKGKA